MEEVLKYLRLLVMMLFGQAIGLKIRVMKRFCDAHIVKVGF